MYCKKRERRDIFNIFSDLSCKDCKYLMSDEEIKIGLKSIHIYYLLNICKYIRMDVCYSTPKSRLIFKDIYVDYLSKPDSRNIFMWLDSYDTFYKYYDVFSLLLDDDYEIYIII